jgi:hypothetical protein
MTSSKTFTFFDFGSTKTSNTPQQLHDKAFDYTKAGKVSELRTLLNGISMDTINKMTDGYDNTILHIATQANKPEIIKYLLNRNMKRNIKNFFGESAWNIAIKSQNEDLIQIFHDIDLLNFDEYKKKVSKYEDENKILKTLNMSLQESNNKLQHNYTFELNKNNSDKKDLLLYKDQNKRLRDENNDLQQKNKKQKIAIDNLIDSMRK